MVDLEDNRTNLNSRVKLRDFCLKLTYLIVYLGTRSLSPRIWLSKGMSFRDATRHCRRQLNRDGIADLRVLFRYPAEELVVERKRLQQCGLSDRNEPVSSIMTMRFGSGEDGSRRLVLD
mmetsp:Transcript_20346/g.46671  ORF Transcript_20346/g.46671 Transcript_20346/m.46671 type:complete len:119 (-) Transcript_20346:2155-2511(-)